MTFEQQRQNPLSAGKYSYHLFKQVNKLKTYLLVKIPYQRGSIPTQVSESKRFA